jgi:hypothetical protein
MNHLSEEQIVLHCFGDADDAGGIEQHLKVCADCRARLEQLQNLLRQIEPTEVPEPPAMFEEKTWLKVRDRLPRRPAGFQQWILTAAGKWALAGAVASLLVAAFFAGRFWPRTAHENPVNHLAADPQKIVMVAVGDHLERSQMLLVEIMNVDTKDLPNLAGEQREARDLLDSNRLYLASAQRVGDPQIARLLDELGRVLTEIANSPSGISPADLEQIRGRIQSDGLLFKVRVVGSEVNSRLRRQGPGADAKTQRL